MNLHMRPDRAQDYFELFGPCKQFIEPANRIVRQMLNNNIIAAGDPPTVTAELACAHVIGGVPLAGPFPKTAIAKEIQFWPDVDGYYTSPESKYLVLSGNALKYNNIESLYDWGVQLVKLKDGVASTMERIQERLAFLVALAHKLGRILVLPRIGE
jgi:hypothetical protein